MADATLVEVPFDLYHWAKVSEENYPNGLPKPYTDDPTQWIFHGHPCGSVVWDDEKKWTAHGPLRTDDTVLQVAVARLLGYRWPAEEPSPPTPLPEGEGREGMELADEQHEWVKPCAALASYADDDGIVCIPPVRGEASASDRLLNLLAAAYDPSPQPLSKKERGISSLPSPSGRGAGGEGAWSNDTLAALLKIFVRWKPIEKQPIGWDPDLNDGVRLNIRPFLSVPDVGKKGAGCLRDKPNINWNKDRGKDPDVPKIDAEWVYRLKALGFMTDGPAGDPVCTIAGLVLFGIRPRQTLKQAGLRLMFFDAPDKIYQARLDKVLDAPLVGRFQIGKTARNLIDAGLIEKALELMEPFVTVEPDAIDEHFRRERKWLYPYEALRELLINALAHRDWTRFVDVEMTGYLDRMEITSPGALPNSMTVEKMLAGQRSARNHIIVEVLRDYGYVDARGMGIRAKVVPALTASGVKWRVDATEDFVKIIIGKASGNDRDLEKKGEKSASKASGKHRVSVGKTSGLILEACQEKPSITIHELANLIGITERSVQRNIQKLQQARRLRRVGGRKEGYWEVTHEGA